MIELKLSEMLEMQLELWEKHKKSWSPMTPEYGKNSMLWMIGEFGEVIQIVKKLGESKIMSDQAVRADFVEEMVDVLMYYNDILLRFGITPEELHNTYISKHKKNMTRNYEKESSQKYMKQ